jgi:quercetin dioxygenase-like cupin family protein
MRTLLLTFLMLFVLLLKGQTPYNSDLVIEQILKTDTTSLGQKINYPSFLQNEVTMLKITIPPGKTTGWHEHGFPVFAYVMKGTLTVEFENNKIMKFHENSSFAEVVNIAHKGVNLEKSDLVLLAIYLGEKGKALSVKREDKK